ncbi:MAG: hypothetical protein R6X13_05920 [bacterium]
MVAAAAMLVVGCDRFLSPAESGLDASSQPYCGVAQEVNLIAGQNIDVGSVTVSNDATNLYVTFATTGDWMLSETHVHVAGSLAEIPQKNGNPIPGQFDYGMSHDPMVMTYSYTIPLNGWTPGMELYVAAHAVVNRVDEYGNVLQSETGWGEGPGFPGRNWAMYLRYTVQDCDPNPDPLIGQFRTQTQGGWGSVPQGNNPGAYLHSNFAGAFPAGLTVGGGFTLSLTSAQAVTDYLPDGGTPVALAQNWVDPGSQMISVLAGQVVALSLSVGFDLYDPNFGASPVNLEDLVVADPLSPYYGWTVQQVLAAANSILGGGPGDPSQVNAAVSSINENFVDGIISNGFLELP